MFEDFLNHKCNIYHMGEEPVNIGYGIAASSIPKEHHDPDETEIPCHFHIKSSTETLKVVQNEPYSSVDGDVKLSLPAGTDIRMNDIIEDCGNGLRYRAGVPKEIHGGHHIIVTLQRQKGIKASI